MGCCCSKSSAVAPQGQAVTSNYACRVEAPQQQRQTALRPEPRPSKPFDKDAATGSTEQPEETENGVTALRPEPRPSKPFDKDAATGSTEQPEKTENGVTALRPEPRPSKPFDKDAATGSTEQPEKTGNGVNNSHTFEHKTQPDVNQKVDVSQPRSKPEIQSFRLREQFKPDIGALKHIDEHVRRTPPSAKLSLQSLAAYLGSAANSDLERIRAVYKWITANISYDVDSFFGDLKNSLTDANSVLRTGKSVCEGYASIGVSLFQLLGIECVKISGYSKGFGYDPTKPLTTADKTSHAWNAVKLDGHWRFIESTWGAGHVTADRKFERCETDFYFLTDPEVFIEAHFPYMNSNMDESKKWQLLEKPIDLNTFCSRVKRRPACIEQEVELVSHQQALVDADGEVTFKFKGAGRPLTSFSANFLDPGTGERIRSSKYVATVLDHRTNVATVTARPPSTGVYWTLNVFASTDKDTKSSDCIVSYAILSKCLLQVPEFPENTLSYYGLYENPENFGFAKQQFGAEGFWIKVDGSADKEFQLEIPASKPISAITNFSMDGTSAGENRFSFVEFNDGFLKISLRMGCAGFYNLELFCKELHSNSSKLSMVANFLVECLKPMTHPQPFPIGYTNAYQQQVHLVCPRDGNLPANSEIRFRLFSPTLKKLMIYNNEYDATGGWFDFSERTGSAGGDFTVYGKADEQAGFFSGLYCFNIV